MLVVIRLAHTIVWALFVACIAGIYLFTARGRFAAALACVGIVLVEVAVLLLNRMRCPLTAVAARYTDDRAENFDIYLPRWLAKHNQVIFGTLYLLGIAYAVAKWALQAGGGAAATG